MLSHPLRAASGSISDIYYQNTVLLLHGDGTNGGQNNTFIDGSVNNYSITRSGNVTQGSASPFTAPNGYWSIYFNAASSFTTGLATIGTSNFTIEAFIYRAVSGSAHTIISRGTTTTGFSFEITTSNTVRFIDTTTNIDTTSTVPTGEWAHVAVVREGTGTNQLKIYINGVMDRQATVSTNFSQTSSARIGADRTPSNYFLGFISNLRVSLSAVYTSNFSPSTSPLTSGSLLVCNDKDAVYSTVGLLNTTSFSPFNAFIPYSTSAIGGSAFFDGIGDRLSISSVTDLTPSGNFTIQFWAYPTSVAVDCYVYTKGYGIQILIDSATQSWRVKLSASNSTTYYVDINSGSLTCRPNQWQHVILTRSSNTYSLYINGSISATTSSASSPNTGANDLVIGDFSAVLGSPYFGYLMDVRYLNGTVSSSLPTSPLTAISNTSILLNFTNGSVYDNTGKNNLETAGNAQISTSILKFGTGSLSFDGTGDWLIVQDKPEIQLRSDKFTIEFFIYPSSTAATRGIIGKGTATTGWLISIDGTYKVIFTYGSSAITSTGSLTASTWSHVAIVREGTGANQLKIYINGTNDGTGTVSTDFNQSNLMYIGANRTATSPFLGNIDELRVTKSIARYTGNFSVPDKAFTDK